ncbi:hypothetical protein [Caldivirga sp. MU80]|uniref:hypothetical protein n=1 Tax=Caldivirga sp. MU80 TaxID=1650354 RepID=UPI0008311A4D|nr:hypothetical protein [Caldivirga sp. MU80]
MNHSKTILILLNGQAVYVGGSTVRVLEVEDVEAIDEEALKRLANRASNSGVKCIEVKSVGSFKVYDCTEPGEEEFMDEVEDLIEDE